MATRSKPFIWDDVLMVALALISAGLLITEYTVTLTPLQTRYLDYADLGIALIFLAEFCIKFALAPKKGQYFKHHWWELLASIPVTTPTTQALRLLRLLRLIRLVRLNEGADQFFTYVNRFVKQPGVLYSFIGWVIVIAASTIGFYYLEHGVNPNLHNLFDSFWWAMSTAATDGYGDIRPVTTAGRILAMFMMFFGMATMAVFTAMVASFLIKPEE